MNATQFIALLDSLASLTLSRLKGCSSRSTRLLLSWEGLYSILYFVASIIIVASLCFDWCASSLSSRLF